MWTETPAELRGQVLVEVSKAVRENLLAPLTPDELRAALAALDADDAFRLARGGIWSGRS